MPQSRNRLGDDVSLARTGTDRRETRQLSHPVGVTVRETAMNPISPLVVSAPTTPNFELLRGAGWAISSFTGSYCVAWRGRDEVVFEWRDAEWHRVGGRSCGAAA